VTFPTTFETTIQGIILTILETEIICIICCDEVWTCSRNWALPRQRRWITGPRSHTLMWLLLQTPCRRPSPFCSPAAEDLGSLHVLLQLLRQPAGLRLPGQQLQKSLQARLPRHISVAHEEESQGGKHGPGGSGRDGSPGTQRRSRDALSFIWVLKVTCSLFIYDLFWRREHAHACTHAHTHICVYITFDDFALTYIRLSPRAIAMCMSPQDW